MAAGWSPSRGAARHQGAARAVRAAEPARRDTSAEPPPGCAWRAARAAGGVTVATLRLVGVGRVAVGLAVVELCGAVIHDAVRWQRRRQRLAVQRLLQAPRVPPAHLPIERDGGAQPPWYVHTHVTRAPPHAHRVQFEHAPRSHLCEVCSDGKAPAPLPPPPPMRCHSAHCSGAGVAYRWTRGST